MAEIQGSRLQERMAAAGLNQSQLARIVDLKQPSIGRLLSGETKESGKLIEIAQALNTTPEYLTGMSDDPAGLPGAVSSPRRGFFSEPAQAMDGLGLVPIREVDIAFGMGGTYLDAVPVQETIIHFPVAWVRQFTDADPSMLVFARGDGDSMSPTINDRDIVLIDQRHRDINRQDRIWAIAYGEIGMIKRVRAMPDGSYKIMSDNAAVEAEIAVDGEMHVIGRVVATIRGL